jgi:hypothetical protein
MAVPTPSTAPAPKRARLLRSGTSLTWVARNPSQRRNGRVRSKVARTATAPTTTVRHAADTCEAIGEAITSTTIVAIQNTSTRQAVAERPKEDGVLEGSLGAMAAWQIIVASIADGQRLAAVVQVEVAEQALCLRAEAEAIEVWTVRPLAFAGLPELEPGVVWVVHLAPPFVPMQFQCEPLQFSLGRGQFSL